MKKYGMVIGILLIFIMIMSFNACTSLNESNGKPDEKKVDAEGFIKGNPTPDKIIKFTNDNVSSLSKENADSLIIALESSQKNMLPTISEEFYKEDVQKALTKNSTSSISELLALAESNGFKIESAEGMYYPIIDYSKYKAWSDIISNDLKSYVAIMAKQSDNPTAKDAALVVSWEELVRRAIEMESFVESYTASVRFNDINEMYKYYNKFVFYGLNNTPLFDYETKTMRKDALIDYKKLTEVETYSNLSKYLKEYLALAEKNNYKLVQEVEDFRNKMND